MSNEESLECDLCQFDSFVYNPDEDNYRASFNTHATQPSLAVVGALSEVLDEDPTQLAPLHNSLDTEALDTIIADSNSDSVEVMFGAVGHQITITGHGQLHITGQQPE